MTLAGWELLRARAREAQSDFWVAASMYESLSQARRASELSQLDETIWQALQDSNWNSSDANGLASRYSLLELDSRPSNPLQHSPPAISGPSHVDTGGVATPGVSAQQLPADSAHFLKDKDKDKGKKGACCPESILVTSAADNSLEDCAASWMFIATAKWSDQGDVEGDDGKKLACRCDCCEVRQFVSVEHDVMIKDRKTGDETRKDYSSKAMVNNPDGGGDSVFKDGGNVSPFDYGPTNSGYGDSPPGPPKTDTPAAHRQQSPTLLRNAESRKVTKESAVKPNPKFHQFQLSRDIFRVSRERASGGTKYWETDFRFENARGKSLNSWKVPAPDQQALNEAAKDKDKKKREEAKDRLRDKAHPYGEGTPFDPEDDEDGDGKSEDGMGGKASKCSYEYMDKPKGTGCWVNKDKFVLEETLKLEFSIVIRPTEDCGGRMLEYRCKLEGGCTRASPEATCQSKEGSSTC